MDIEEKQRRDVASSVAQTTPTGDLDSIDSATLTLMAGICLSVPAMISLSAGEPEPLSPMPLLVVVPAFLVHVGAVLVPVLLSLCGIRAYFAVKKLCQRGLIGCLESASCQMWLGSLVAGSGACSLKASGM
jgi:hypothetical protein